MEKRDPQKYVLGLDLGSASLGWAAVLLGNDDKPTGILRMGVRVFDPGVSGTQLDIEQGKDESKAVERRRARLQRRQLRRRAARQRELFEVLQAARFLPPYSDHQQNKITGETTKPGGHHVLARSEARHEILNQLDRQLYQQWRARMNEGSTAVPAGDHVLPYFLRAQALREKLQPLELGRALYHLGQRRGFLSNRKASAKNAAEKEDQGKVKNAISELGGAIQSAGAATLGEYFAGVDPAQARIRNRWTGRAMYQDEFESIWAAQTPYYPELLTAERKRKLTQLLFFQRPVASQSHLVAQCELEPRQKRAPMACLEAQRFRMLQGVTNLRMRTNRFEERELTDEERRKLIAALESQGDLSFEAIRAVLDLPKPPKGTRLFNFQRGKTKGLRGNRTGAHMRSVFGERWDQFSEADQKQIVEEWRTIESDAALSRRGQTRWGLSAEQARAWCSREPEPGHAGLSRKAIRKLLPEMETGISFKTAEEKHYGARFSGGKIYDLLPPVRQGVPTLRNPAVERALTELRKVLNALVRKHGKPYEVHIELARDLKNPREVRKEIQEAIEDRTAEREKMKAKILAETGEQHPSRAKVEKALLWEECGGICPYTGKPINFHDLFGDAPQFDVEHILPFSRCPDDSFANKTLCHIPENRNVKKNHTPWEVYGHEPARWQEILDRAKRVKNWGKLKRFQVKTAEELEKFSHRQLNDTRYATKLAGKYVGLLYGGRDAEGIGGSARRIIHTSPGQLTAILRRNWGLEEILREPEAPAAAPGSATPKARGDHRHHSIDALVTALTGPAAVKLLSDAAERNWNRGRVSFKGLEAPWPNFVDSVRMHIEQMNISHRPERHLSGRFHDETNYSQPYALNGKTYVHVRKPITELSKEEIQNIVDPAVRRAVQARILELGDVKRLKTDGVAPPLLKATRGPDVPIRKVRLRKVVSAVAIGDGLRERHVALNSNHHVEIVAELDKRGEETAWQGIVVSRKEAQTRLRKAQPLILKVNSPEDELRFKFSLADGDTVEMDDQRGERTVFVLRSMSEFETGTVQFSFVKHTDARLKKDVRASHDLVRIVPNVLRKRKARKVVIDLLGEVHPAND